MILNLKFGFIHDTWIAWSLRQRVRGRWELVFFPLDKSKVASEKSKQPVVGKCSRVFFSLKNPSLLCFLSGTLTKRVEMASFRFGFQPPLLKKEGGGVSGIGYGAALNKPDLCVFHCPSSLSLFFSLFSSSSSPRSLSLEGGGIQSAESLTIFVILLISFASLPAATAAGPNYKKKKKTKKK